MTPRGDTHRRIDDHPPCDAERANRLAKAIQGGFPLVPEPLRELATGLDMTPAVVLAQLRRWQAEGVFREISAVLEGSALGHDSALVAGVVPAADLERVAGIVSAHPTVTHNYLRDHHYNLWFTISVPDEMGLEATLEILARETGVPRFHPLRRTHTFKIGVNFDLQARRNETSTRPLSAPPTFRADETARAMFRALQRPLPLAFRPFAVLAETAGFGEDELLAFACRHLGGAIRKYVATFHHRRIGVRGNGMVVWRVPKERVADLGHALARAPEVSHCYARNPIEGFPGTLYSMLHGPDAPACRKTAARLSEEIGIHDYLILFSTREYKKCRLRYFLPELDEWWDRHTSSQVPILSASSPGASG